MSQPVVYDASALLALFEAEDTAFGYWQRADAGRSTVVFPAAAVADANTTLRAHYDAWSGVLWAKGVSVAPLDGSAAVETGLHCRDSIVTAHVVQEARAVRGYILTSSPQAYAGTRVPVLVF